MPSLHTTNPPTLSVQTTFLGLCFFFFFFAFSSGFGRSPGLLKGLFLVTPGFAREVIILCAVSGLPAYHSVYNWGDPGGFLFGITGQWGHQGWLVHSSRQTKGAWK